MNSNFNLKINKSVNTSSDIPPEIKSLFEDKDNNGTLDIIDNALDSGKITTNIEINGQKYDSWDDVPEEFRKIKDLPAQIQKIVRPASPDLTAPAAPAIIRKSNYLFSFRTIIFVIFLAVLLILAFRFLL